MLQFGVYGIYCIIKQKCCSPQRSRAPLSLVDCLHTDISIISSLGHSVDFKLCNLECGIRERRRSEYDGRSDIDIEFIVIVILFMLMNLIFGGQRSKLFFVVCVSLICDVTWSSNDNGERRRRDDTNNIDHGKR